MTFDLFFYRRTEEPRLAPEIVSNILGSIPKFSVQQIPNGREYLYRNDLTGVYFQVFYSAVKEDENAPPYFSGLEYSGLMCHVNFARPTFFAMEAFPTIVGVAEKLGLVILDNQLTSAHKEPRKFTAEELVDSWRKSNEWTVKTYRSQGGSVNFMPRERLDYVWNFHRLNRELRQKHGDRVFVPTRIFLLKNRLNSPLTSCSWANYMTQIFPIVDLVQIGKSKKLGGFEDKGLASLADIRRGLGDLMREETSPIPHLVIESEEIPKELRNTLEKIPFQKSKEFQGVPWDQVVDVAP